MGMRACSRFIFLFLFIGQLFAAPSPEVNTPANQLAGLLGQYQSLTAHFDQTINDSKGRTVQVSSGNMALLKSGSLRWETQTPTEQLIISNGKTLWIYDKDLQQVTINQLKKKTGATPGMLMTTSGADLQSQYLVSIYPSAKNKPVFQIVPKMKNADFESVRFFFNDKNLVKMQIHDNIDQVTTIDFSHMVKNPPLPDTLFHLTIPKDVDVVKE